MRKFVDASTLGMQWRLSFALFATIVLTGALAGVLSYFWALHDANEILDTAVSPKPDGVLTRALLQRRSDRSLTEGRDEAAIGRAACPTSRTVQRTRADVHLIDRLLAQMG